MNRFIKPETQIQRRPSKWLRRESLYPAELWGPLALLQAFPAVPLRRSLRMALKGTCLSEPWRSQESS
jgi:hypothetical protein